MVTNYLVILGTIKLIDFRVRDCRGAERPPQRSEEAGAIAEPRKARPERSEGNTQKNQKEQNKCQMNL